MELNLHPIATKSFVSGREFQEHDRVVSYLVREAPSAGAGPVGGAITRRDLLESEDPPAEGWGTAGEGGWVVPSFVYCRWVVSYKQRKAGENPALTLKLTAENLFLTLAVPANAAEDADPGADTGAPSAVNTPLLQFLALMLERKKLIKLRGVTADGLRQLYEHMPSHQLYEVPVGDLNAAFFQKIQEHLGVLVGNPKPKAVLAGVPAAG